jgi:hypothetical protein
MIVKKRRTSNIMAEEIKAALRKSFYDAPRNEREVQDHLQMVLDLLKYESSREAYAISYSGRSYTPDFVVEFSRSTAKGKIGAAIEVKLCNSKARVKRIIDEISADIPAYRKHFHPILFVIYDMGFIRNEDTLRKDIERQNPGTRVVVVKH